MSTLRSLILRIAYLAIVLFFAFWIGIAVAMGFDAGYSVGAIAVACVYLFTFVPALILGFLRLKTITSPPKALKLWYWWAAFLGALLVAYKIYFFSKAVTGYAKLAAEGPSYGTVCFQVTSNETNETEAWVDVASPQSGFQRFRQIPIDKKEWCANVGLSMNPIRVQAYSVSGKNRKGFKATDEDDLSEALTVAVSPGKTACLAITPLGNPPDSSRHWGVQEVPCAR